MDAAPLAKLIWMLLSLATNFLVRAIQVNDLGDEHVAAMFTLDLGGTQGVIEEAALADLLVKRGLLTPSDRADVDKLLQRKLGKHSGDAQAGLAEVTTDRVLQSLEHDNCTTFGTYVTIGGFIKSLAAAIWREHVRAREPNMHLRGEDHVDATSQRKIAFVNAQTLTGQVHRIQRRRTGCTDGHGWPMHAVRIGQSSCGHAG